MAISSSAVDSSPVSALASDKPVVLIYRNELLAPSETFIPAQAEAFTRFTPVYVGLKQMPGLALPAERSLVFAAGSSRTAVQLSCLRRKLLGPTRQDLQRLSRLKPVLIHAHFGIDGSQAMLLAQALKIPLVVTFHGFDATMDDKHIRATSLAGKLYLRRRKALIEQTSRAICVSEFIRKSVIAQGFPAAKTLVHYIGIDTCLFEPSAEIQREPLVLFVGRLVEKKGCEFLIQAMRRLSKQGIGAKLIIVGAGPLRAALEREAAANLTNYQFLGLQTSQQIKDLMNRATVFCAPSIIAKSGDSEGFGMVFLEAQSMGLPVVSFDTGGVPEAVENGVTGLLAPSHNVDTLAQHLGRLLTSQSSWEAFSRAGKQRVHDQFDVRQQTAKLEQVYLNLLA